MGLKLELVGVTLKVAGQTLCLSQTSVGTYVGIPRQAVAALESGKRFVPVPQLIKFANLFRREFSWFLEPQPAATRGADLPKIERRRNQGREEDELDHFDREEIARCASDLQSYRTDPQSPRPITKKPSGLRTLSA